MLHLKQIGSDGRIKCFNEIRNPNSFSEGKLRELSGVCSALWVSGDWESAMDDDLAAFHAPSECRQLAYAGIIRRRLQILEDWGWTAYELDMELGRRGVDRWLYFSGFGKILEDLLEAEDQLFVRMLRDERIRHSDEC